MSAPITAVWTDFGGVLTPPISHTMAAFCRNTGIDQAALMAAVGTVTAGYGTHDMMEPIDTPMVSEAQWLAEIGDVLEAEHGITARLTTLADAWFDGRETDEEWVEQLRELRARGLFVGMMSNMVPEWDGHWRRMVSVDELFDDVLLSFQVGTRKPRPDMFALAARRAGTQPQHCLLVDDLEQNCAGARAAGWAAVRYTGAAAARAEIDQLLAAPV